MSIYKSFLKSALLQAFALDRLYQSETIDRVFVFSGRLFPMQIALDLARKREIKCYLHERGTRQETVSVLPLTENSIHPAENSSFSLWENVPLNENEIKNTLTLLQEREKGSEKALGWGAFSPPSGGGKLRQRLRIKPEARIWSFFTSSEDELKDFSGYFGDFTQEEAIISAINLIKDFDDIHLVIRVHPNVGSKRSIGVVQNSIAFFQVLAQKRHSNFTIVHSYEDISTYELMNETEVGLVFFSTCGLELACKGKPVICLAKPEYAMHNISYPGQTRQLLYDSIKSLYHRVDRNQVLEKTRLAFRYMHFKYYISVFDFPFVKQLNPYEGIPSYKNIYELEPGKNISLDWICTCILNGTDTFKHPTDDYYRRSLEAENILLLQFK